MRKLWGWTSVFLMIFLSTCQADSNPQIPTDNDTIRVLWVGDRWTANNLLDMQTLLFIDHSHSQVVFQMEREQDPKNVISAGGFPSALRTRLSKDFFDIIIVQAFGRDVTVSDDQFLENALSWQEGLQVSGAQIVLLYPAVPLGTDQSKVERLDNLVHQTAWSDKWVLAPVGTAFGKKQNLALYDEDGDPLSARGNYLSACIMFSVLTGDSPVGMPVTTAIGNSEPQEIVSLSAEEAAELQNTAHEVIEHYQSRGEFSVQISVKR